MAEFKKPNLPDPGPGRWWEIELDIDGDWRLVLKKDDIASPWNLGVEITSELLYDQAVAKDFEYAATNILNRLDKAAAFIGTYHKK